MIQAEWGQRDSIAVLFLHKSYFTVVDLCPTGGTTTVVHPNAHYSKTICFQWFRSKDFSMEKDICCYYTMLSSIPFLDCP